MASDERQREMRARHMCEHLTSCPWRNDDFWSGLRDTLAIAVYTLLKNIYLLYLHLSTYEIRSDRVRPKHHRIVIEQAKAQLG